MIGPVRLMFALFRTEIAPLLPPTPAPAEPPANERPPELDAPPSDVDAPPVQPLDDPVPAP